MIDSVVGRRISQDPGHAIGWHCNVPERLGGRPSSQILDSGRLQPHDESRVTPLENSSFLPSPLGKRTSESVPAVIGTALPSPPPPPRRWRKLDAAAKSERATLFYEPVRGHTHCRMSPRDQPAFTHGIRNGLCFRQGPFLTKRCANAFQTR